MINKNKFKALLVEHGITVNQLSKELGISKATFYVRLNNNSFDTKDIDLMIKIFKISDKEKFIEIFFSNFVA